MDLKLTETKDVNMVIYQFYVVTMVSQGVDGRKPDHIRIFEGVNWVTPSNNNS